MNRIIILFLFVFLGSFANAQKKASQAAFKKGEKAFKKEQYQEAVNYFTKAIDAGYYPEATVYEARSMSYWVMDNYEMALKDISTAIFKNSRVPSLYRKRGLIKYDLEMYKDAIGDFTKALSLNSDDFRALRGRTLVYIELEELDKAMEDVTRALEIKPDYEEAIFQRARIYTGQGKFDLAIKDYTTCLETSKKDPVIWGNRGLVKIDAEDYTGALEDLFEANRLRPNKIRYFTDIAFCYSNMEEHQKCIEYANKAIVMDSAYSIAYSHKAYAYKNLGNYDEANRNFTIMIDLGDDPFRGYYGRSNVKLNQSDWLSGIEDMDSAIVYFQYEEIAWNNRAFMKLFVEQYETAIPDATKAIELRPDFAYAFNNRGRAKSKLGMHEEALIDFNKSLELDDTNDWAYSYRGQNYEEMGKLELALIDFEKAVEIAPKNEEYIEQLRKLKERIAKQ